MTFQQANLSTMSIREWRNTGDAPLREGLPDFCRPSVLKWFESAVGGRASYITFEEFGEAVRFAFETPHTQTQLHAFLFGSPNNSTYDDTCSRWEGADSLVLDLIDVALSRIPSPESGWCDSAAIDLVSRINTILAQSRSVWVAMPHETAHRLERHMPASMVEAVERLSGTPGDLCTDSWHEAFGIHPNPEAATSIAIKAVEAALCPLVLPSDNKATLGKVIHSLRSEATKDPAGRSFVIDVHLPVDSNNARSPFASFVEVVASLWPGPNRHGGGAGPDLVPEHQGQAAALTATWVVSLIQLGIFRRA